MEQILTVCIGLDTTDEQYRALTDTAVAFADACSWINETVNPRLTNRNSIQAVCYREAKTQFGLTANHVVRACARVAANRLAAKAKKSKPKEFAPTSFDCDSRTLRIIEKGIKREPEHYWEKSQSPYEGKPISYRAAEGAESH